MLQLHKRNITNIISVYPDTLINFTNSGESFKLIISQDLTLERTFTEINLTLLNQPTLFNPRLVFQLSTDQLPSLTGQYSYDITTSIGVRSVWSNTNTLWSLTSRLWNLQTGGVIGSTIDTGKAWLEGTDLPIIDRFDIFIPEKTYNG